MIVTLAATPAAATGPNPYDFGAGRKVYYAVGLNLDSAGYQGVGAVSADVGAAAGNPIQRVQIDRIVLGNRQGVLATGGPVNSGTSNPPYAQAGTRHVRLSGSQDCHVRVHIYASVRFASGALRYTDWLGPEWSQPCT